MNTKKLVAKVASTAFVVLTPIATFCLSGTKPAAHIETGTSIGLNQAPLTHGHLVSVACQPAALLSTFEMQ